MQLRITWFIPLPLAVIADAKGLCARHGVEVETVSTRSSDEQFDALAAGEVDAAVTAMDNVFMWNRRGPIADLRILAQMEASTALSLMARKGIDSIARLKGGELLVDSPENGFVVVLRAILRDAGLGMNEYRLVVAGGVRERFEALMAGTGDATLLVPFFEKEVIQAGGAVLARVNELYPDFPGQCLMARQASMPAKAPALRAWLAALEDARGWARENPQGALALLRERRIAEPVARGLLSAVPDSFVPSPSGVDLLISQRRSLGLPGAEGGRDEILDDRLLSAARGSSAPQPDRT